MSTLQGTGRSRSVSGVCQAGSEKGCCRRRGARHAVQPWIRSVDMALGKRRRRLASVGLGVSLALATTGCLQDPSANSGGVGGVSGTVDNNQDDGDGVVTILGAYGGDEKKNFEKALAPFEKE